MTESAPRFEHEFPISKELLRNAARRDIRDLLLMSLLLYAALMGAVYWFYGSFDTPTWVVVVVGVVIILLIVRHRFRRAIDALADLLHKTNPDGLMRVLVDDEGFTSEAGDSRTRFAWSALVQLWCYPDVWLLQVGPKVSVILPPDAPEPMREFVVARCRAAGVRVR